MELINEALQQYGASLTNDNHIQRNNKVMSVKVVIRGKRLRFEGGNNQLLCSGQISKTCVESFVEDFWFWKKEVQQ